MEHTLTDVTQLNTILCRMNRDGLWFSPHSRNNAWASLANVVRCRSRVCFLCAHYPLLSLKAPFITHGSPSALLPLPTFVRLLTVLLLCMYCARDLTTPHKDIGPQPSPGWIPPPQLHLHCLPPAGCNSHF